jgi:Chalcone isomerase-like
MVFRILFLALFSLPAASAELEGVRLDDRIKVDGQELQLNGIGLRTRYALFKVYVAGLYLRQKANAAAAVIDDRGAKRIILVMVRDAEADQFVASIDAGLRANNSEAQLAEVKAQVDELYAKIRGVREARDGTRIVLDYSPSSRSTTLFVDGAAQGGPMAGEAFYDALLKIWLGERPVQEDMKKALLGG